MSSEYVRLPRLRDAREFSLIVLAGLWEWLRPSRKPWP